MNFETVLKELRTQRNFDSKKYFDKKYAVVNDFFTTNNLDTVVVGLSGGVDSALVLYMFNAFKNMPFSPIKNVVPVIAPIKDVDGVSGQIESEELALKLCDELKLEPFYINLKYAYDAIIDTDHKGNNSWSEGQMASVLRTPVMYYVAALEQVKGNKSIVLGTTNKSEGSYIGFYGKASDGMNDLQPIADLYKSEVFTLSKDLGVPDYILERVPMGDVYNGDSDEKLMGVTYDQLEFFLLECEGYSHINFRSSLPCIIREKIFELHNKNKHKYNVGLPSHMLNVFGFQIPGGWTNYPNKNL